jgi:hypothetical protein
MPPCARAMPLRVGGVPHSSIGMLSSPRRPPLDTITRTLQGRDRRAQLLGDASTSTCSEFGKLRASTGQSAGLPDGDTRCAALPRRRGRDRRIVPMQPRAFVLFHDQGSGPPPAAFIGEGVRKARAPSRRTKVSSEIRASGRRGFRSTAVAPRGPLGAKITPRRSGGLVRVQRSRRPPRSLAEGAP